MKARISIDNNFLGIYTDQWLQKNKDLIINGQLTSEWITVEVSDQEALFLTDGYKLIDNIWIAPEGPTEEEVFLKNANILSLHVAYPELSGQNFKLLSLDNLEGIKRDSTLADKGLKGEKKYRKEDLLIWSSEKIYWFQPNGYNNGFRRITRLFDMNGNVSQEWENYYDLSADDKQVFLKQQRELIFEYFKSQQKQLFNFLYAFFSKEINDYVMTGGNDLRDTLIDAAENHPYQENDQYIVRLTLNMVIPTQTENVTTTVLQGILDELQQNIEYK